MTTTSPSRPRPAAFFDLDKTVLSTASSIALRDPLLDAGLITRRSAALGLLIHLPYLVRGADDRAMEHMREALGALARGWDATVVESTVRDALTRSIDPLCFTEALDMIALHRSAGQAVVVASASVEEMVRPIAEMLGADFSIGSRAEVDEDGVFTGIIGTYTSGQQKALACAELASDQGWEPSECFAYSDSVSDLPLLEWVGHPVAVNPDRALHRIALERRWQVMSFTHTVRVRPRRVARVVPALAAAVALGLTVLAAWKVHHA